jgi:hypothetical protein
MNWKGYGRRPLSHKLRLYLRIALEVSLCSLLSTTPLRFMGEWGRSGSSSLYLLSYRGSVRKLSWMV